MSSVCHHFDEINCLDKNDKCVILLCSLTIGVVSELSYAIGLRLNSLLS